ncbi:MAG: hypothetical protein L7F77_08750 [Candidatus Magnetominusculus sp. LBB02]|nr:hypothetical protein [Candidatus Magnetominusculus sp. LBB02]
MMKDDINNNVSGDFVREMPKQTRGTVTQIERKPMEMTEYVQFRINAFNERARKLYDVMVTEKSLNDFKKEASAITSEFVGKVRDIVDVPEIKWVVEEIKSKPAELRKELASFYKDITGSVKKTYFSLVWLYANYPNVELKVNPDDGGNGDGNAGSTHQKR